MLATTKRGDTQVGICIGLSQVKAIRVEVGPKRPPKFRGVRGDSCYLWLHFNRKPTSHPRRSKDQMCTCHVKEELEGGHSALIYVLHGWMDVRGSTFQLLNGMLLTNFISLL